MNKQGFSLDYRLHTQDSDIKIKTTRKKKCGGERKGEKLREEKEERKEWNEGERKKGKLPA